MAIDVDDLPYIRAAHYGGRLQGGVATVITVHTAETDETPTSAEGVANYFAGGVGASTHWTCDNDSVIQCVPYDQRCWGAGEGPANDVSVQMELSGRAAQDLTEWHDPYSRDLLIRAAATFKDYIAKYNPDIRAVRLTGAQLQAGERNGFTGHADWHEGWPAGDYRSDPGPEFPWDELLAMVSDSGPTPAQIAEYFALLEYLKTLEDDMQPFATEVLDDGRLLLACRNNNNEVFYKFQKTDGSWDPSQDGWKQIPGQTFRTPQLVKLADGGAHLLVVGTSNSGHYAYLPPGGTEFSGFASIGGSIAS